MCLLLPGLCIVLTCQETDKVPLKDVGCPAAAPQPVVQCIVPAVLNLVYDMCIGEHLHMSHTQSVAHSHTSEAKFAHSLRSSLLPRSLLLLTSTDLHARALLEVPWLDGHHGELQWKAQSSELQWPLEGSVFPQSTHLIQKA
jgi:hypothetical protein